MFIRVCIDTPFLGISRLRRETLERGASRGEDVEDVEVDDGVDVDDVDVDAAKGLVSAVSRTCRKRVPVARRAPSGVRVSH